MYSARSLVKVKFVLAQAQFLFFEEAMATTETLVPLFLSSADLKATAKLHRLNHLPRLQQTFVKTLCSDNGISVLPEEAPDAKGEHIVGAALIRFSATWSPLLPMNEQKRSMSCLFLSIFMILIFIEFGLRPDLC